MKRLLLSTAIVTGAMFFGPNAFATPSPVTITGSYSIGETYDDLAYNSVTNLMGGGPAITGNLGNGIVNTTSGTSGNFSFVFTPGVSYTYNLATFNPFASCNGASCSGGIETDPINISFAFTSPSGASATTSTATFKAKYALPYLSCDPGGDGAGKSDCVTWTTSPIVANFSDGAKMNITLNNAADWAITPTVTFDVINGPTAVVPEPISVACLGIGMVGLGMVKRRRSV